MRLSTEPIEIFGYIAIGMLIGSILCHIGMNVNKASAAESVHDSHFTGFEWKGHNYLRYSDYNTHTYTLLHDPNCPCMTNKVEVIQ